MNNGTEKHQIVKALAASGMDSNAAKDLLDRLMSQAKEEGRNEPSRFPGTGSYRSTVTVDDEPSACGAHHIYSIHQWEDAEAKYPGIYVTTIRFQKGNVQEVGVNGVSDTILLQIILDRLKAFQKSEKVSFENQMTILCLTEALHWQQEGNGYWGHERSSRRRAMGLDDVNLFDSVSPLRATAEPADAATTESEDA